MRVKLVILLIFHQQKDRKKIFRFPMQQERLNCEFLMTLFPFWACICDLLNWFLFSLLKEPCPGKHLRCSPLYKGWIEPMAPKEQTYYLHILTVTDLGQQDQEINYDGTQIFS